MSMNRLHGPVGQHESLPDGILIGSAVFAGPVVDVQHLWLWWQRWRVS